MSIVFKKHIKNGTLELLNALRRTLISKIETFSCSIETTIVHKNSSIFNNDILRHRLCSIPLKIQNHSVTFDINFTCSKDSNTDVLFTSDDIPELVPGIDIITLRPGQSIQVSMISSKKYGNCVTNVILKQHRVIHFDNEPITIKHLEQFPEIFNRIPIENIPKDSNWTDLNLIQNINEIIGSQRVTIKDLPNFDFSFETINLVPAEKVLKQAIEYIIEQLDEQNITDHSIANLLVATYYNFFTKREPRKILSIIKKHPTDKNFIVMSFPRDNYDFEKEKQKCIEIIKDEINTFELTQISWS